MPVAGGGERDNDCVRVAVRCRPLNSTEKKQGHSSIVTMDRRRGLVAVKNPSAGRDEPPKSYTFDLCFPTDTKQVDIYNETARPIVNSVLEGYNGTIFAYGQTGTGKTFTMEGDRSKPEMCGIIPNSFAHIFGHISKASGDVTFLVRCSYLEIYCEDVRDLLGKDQKKRLQVKERKDVGVYVKDLSAFVVRNADDMDKIMSRGNVNRMTGETKMNARSSRSHAIFTIMIERSEKAADGSDALRMGKLNLVDLAGSERQSKTGAEGQRLKEATKINLSLSSLGNVISSLVDGKSSHIPYRDSKLTRLLQDSLGGNAKTVMIANFGPANYNYEETLGTLRYANRAKQIKNKPKINENPKDALLREFQKQIEELRKQLENEGGARGDNDDDGGEYTGSSEDDDDDGDGQVGWDGKKRKKKKKRHKTKVVRRVVSPTKMAAMQQEIDAEKKLLQSKKEMTSEEKERIAQELADREKHLQAVKRQREELSQKMEAIHSKVIVGGVNLLDKAEEQERMLDEAQAELEARQHAEENLHQQIQDRDEEVIEIEKQYSSLTEAAADMTGKLKRVWEKLRMYEGEVEDLNKERQIQNEDLVANIRELSRELRLNMLVIDYFIPPEYQDEIEKQAEWNEEIGEWHMPGIAYTGNNMRKTAAHLLAVEPQPAAPEDETNQLEKHYFSYDNVLDANGARLPKGRPKTGKKSGRPKTSKSRARGDDQGNAGGGGAAQQYPVSRPARPGTARSRAD